MGRIITTTLTVLATAAGPATADVQTAINPYQFAYATGDAQAERDGAAIGYHLFVYPSDFCGGVCVQPPQEVCGDPVCYPEAPASGEARVGSSLRLASGDVHIRAVVHLGTLVMRNASEPPALFITGQQNETRLGSCPVTRVSAPGEYVVECSAQGLKRSSGKRDLLAVSVNLKASVQALTFRTSPAQIDARALVKKITVAS